MSLAYRLGTHASYAARAGAALAAVSAALGLAACAGERPPVPPNVTIASARAAALPTPAPGDAAADPRIVAARFSTLDPALGTTLRGDVVVSTDTTRVALVTNLFDVAARRAGPGRFHVEVRVYDLPAFLVRPYALKIVARNDAGRETTLVVPFRIVGRPTLARANVSPL